MTPLSRAREVEARLRLAAEALPDHRIQAKREDIALILREAASALSALIAECETAKAELAEAVKLMGKLSNEVIGSMPLMEALARREFGNSNYNIMMLRAEEARAFIARHPQPVPVGGEKGETNG